MSLSTSRPVKMAALPLAFVLLALAVVETPQSCSLLAHVFDASLAAAETMFVVGFVAALAGSQEPPKRRSKLGTASDRYLAFGKPQDRAPEKYGLVLLVVAVVLAVSVIVLMQGSVSRECIDGLAGFL